MAKIELNNLSSGYNINTINVNFGKIETEFKDKVVYRDEASPMSRDLDVNGYGVINLRNPAFSGDAVSYGFLLNSDAFSFTGLEYKGSWQPGINYAKNNYVTVDGFVYISQEPHTSSSSFSTDLSSGKWLVFSSGGGDLISTNNLNDIASFSVARNNLNVPSRSGEGATGNWSINAATATLAEVATNAINSDNSDLVNGVAEPQLVKQTTATGSAILPSGTTAQRDVAPSAGFLRFNTTVPSLEVYSGSSWDSYTAPSDATTSVKGIVELATTTEASTGTDTTRAVTPAGVEAHMNANALGWNQTWQNLTGSRATSTTYTNNSGKPIEVKVIYTGGGTYEATFEVDGVQRVYETRPAGAWVTVGAIVPHGSTYRATSTGTYNSWSELR